MSVAPFGVSGEFQQASTGEVASLVKHRGAELVVARTGRIAAEGGVARPLLAGFELGQHPRRPLDDILGRGFPGGRDRTQGVGLPLAGAHRSAPSAREARERMRSAAVVNLASMRASANDAAYRAASSISARSTGTCVSGSYVRRTSTDLTLSRRPILSRHSS